MSAPLQADPSDSPRAAIVVAVALNGVIGQRGALPWRMEHDLRLFRRLTLGKPIIMGRKTFAAIGRPLDQRLNIVISRHSKPTNVAVRLALSPGEAIKIAYAEALKSGCDEYIIIGGAQVFAATLAQTARIYLTRVQAQPAGDTFFPDLNPDEWCEMSRDPLPVGPRDDYEADLIVYDRIKNPNSSA